MANDIRIDITVATDAQSVALEIVQDGTALAHAILDAPALDQVISALGAARAGLKDIVPPKLDPVPRLQATLHPNWWVFDPMPEGRTLALRHPGYGWLAFVLAPNRANEIAEWLKWADKSDPKPF